MKDITKLLEISQTLKKDDVYSDLLLIKERLEQPNKDIVIPLVGEFSSGKTALINALTDTKKLESASKATTATIFEIRFGKENSYAEIVDANDQESRVDDISELKNELLADTKLVRVYDTSKKVPDTTILVDTPGLSSSDAKHKLALTSYLPFADAIFMVIDVNQQITRSLLDFVESTKLTQKPIYLIITKCDTKTDKEVAEVKKYIAENIHLPLDYVVCTSANDENLDELYSLFENIQKDKNRIVENALEERVEKLAGHLSQYITDLLKNLSSTSDLDTKIEEQNDELEKINRNIDRLIRDASDGIDRKADDCERKFKNTIFDRLDSIIKNQGRDCDEAVYTTVNTVALNTLERYKKDIQHVLTNLARERKSRLEAVPLQMLESLDLSSIAFDSFSYDMNLSELGHKHDKLAGNIIIGAAAIAAVAATAGAAAGAVGAAEVGAAAGAGKLINVADTATDIMSMRKMSKLQKTMQTGSKMLQAGTKVNEQIGIIEGYNQQLGQKFLPQQRGMVETGVSWITDKFWGKPQRKRAINNYIDETLLPEFKEQMKDARTDLTNMISTLLREEANNATVQMKEVLKEMEEEKKSELEVYKQKVNQLKEYRELLK